MKLKSRFCNWLDRYGEGFHREMENCVYRNGKIDILLRMNFQALSRHAGVAATIGLLVLSNLLMTFAWYWHLRKTPTGEQGLS